MSYGTVLLKGLGEFIAAHGLGVWRENGIYTNERGIVIAAFPDKPDEIISLTRYSTTYVDDEATTLIQIRYRMTGHPFAALELYDDLHDLLHRKTHLNFGGVRISRVMERSFSPMGTDKTGRSEFTHNFVFTGPRWVNPIITPSGD